MAATKAAPLVWINGFPATGKLTVATAMATLHDRAIVFDNHKLIDPVEKTYLRTHPDYQKERQLYRKAVLDEYVCSTDTLSRLVIFTGNELGRSVAMEYKDAARQAGRPFIPIYLTCDIDANIERIASRDRMNSGTKKLTDAQMLKGLRTRCELFRFDGYPCLDVDSTGTAPLETARKILAFVEESSDSQGCPMTT